MYFTWRVFTCAAPFDRTAYKNYCFDFIEQKPFLSFEAQGTNILLRVGNKRAAEPLDSSFSKEMIHNFAGSGLATNFSLPVSVSPDMSIGQIIKISDTLREQGMPRFRLLTASRLPSDDAARLQFAELKLGDFQSYFWHQKEWFFEDRQAREARKASPEKDR